MHESQCKSEKISELEQTIKDLQRALLQSQSEIRENETTRRLLHNLIQELKGSDDYTLFSYSVCKIL